MDRYLVTGTIRSDGSSVLPEIQMGPSVIAAAWIVSEENFLKDSKLSF